MADKIRADKARPKQVEEVGPTGIYPASGPLPPGNAKVIGQGELGHPEEREGNTRDHDDQDEQDSDKDTSR